MSTEVSRGTMRDLEMALIALTDVDSEALTPELRAEYEAELKEAVRAVPEKRDAVAAAMFSLGMRADVKDSAALSHEEKAEDLRRSATQLQREAKRLGDYVLSVMAELPKPSRGVRTLEGTSSTFKAKGVADSIEIYDESLLPDEFRTATITIPIDTWHRWVVGDTSSVSAELHDLPVKWGRVESSIIKAAAQRLESCLECGGCGEVTNGNPSVDVIVKQCPRCAGTGKTPVSIPGVRLVTGKLRLEVS